MTASQARSSKRPLDKDQRFSINLPGVTRPRRAPPTAQDRVSPVDFAGKALLERLDYLTAYSLRVAYRTRTILSELLPNIVGGPNAMQRPEACNPRINTKKTWAKKIKRGTRSASTGLPGTDDGGWGLVGKEDAKHGLMNRVMWSAGTGAGPGSRLHRRTAERINHRAGIPQGQVGTQQESL